MNIYLFIRNAFYYYRMLLVIYALMSWFPNARNNRLGQLISDLVRPYLNVFDRLIPPLGGVSFNVIIGLLVLTLIETGVITILGYLLN